MVNDFNRFYVLARRLDRGSNEIKYFINLTDTTHILSKYNYYNKFFVNKDFHNVHFKEFGATLKKIS